MKILRLLLSVVLLGGLLYFLGNGQSIAGNDIPPLGKFLNPFQGYLQNGSGMDPVSAEFEFSNLSAPVSVAYDSNLVPHIYAENEKDLYFAQGYVIANLRLWQMEFQVMAASGRVSEVIGDRALSLDRSQRRIGLPYGAEKVMAWMEDKPDLMESLESYAAGVNAYIDNLEYKDYPIEYKLLDYSPEGWEPYKTALVLQYMSHMLTGFDRDIENTNFVSMFGKQTYDRLFPEWIDEIAPVIPTFTPWDFDPLPTIEDSVSYDSVAIVQAFKPNPANGSNNWAISGEKTRNGAPLLANDTHLGLNLPSLWVTIQLHSPNLHNSGLVFTGTPGVVIGHNDSIAWGFTNSPRDQRDWYSVSFKDDSRKEYSYDGEWKRATQRVETIKVKGQPDFLDTVIYTHHGPIVYDQNFQGESARSGLALRWIGHEPSRLMQALYILGRAKNYDEYTEAVSYWDAPPQNIVFAATNGDIALRVEGTFPLKWREQGKFVLDGSNPNHEWQGYVPHDQNAFLLNPDRQYVSSANQHQVDPDYPYWAYSSSLEYYRNRRINFLLDSLQDATPDDFMEMHMDVHSLKAEEILPLLLDSLDKESITAEDQEYLDIFEGWDYKYEPGLAQPAVFEIWWSSLNRLLWDEIRSKNIPLNRPGSYVTYHLLKNGLINDFVDVANTSEVETLTDLVTKSFLLSLVRIEEWEEENGEDITWKSYSGVRLSHIARVLPPFNSEVLATGGSGSSILAANGGHGPSQRFIVELTTPPRSWIIYPGGQSGNPGSQHYLDQVDRYVEGGYIEINTLGKLPETLIVQEFKPANQ